MPVLCRLLSFAFAAHVREGLKFGRRRLPDFAKLIKVRQCLDISGLFRINWLFRLQTACAPTNPARTVKSRWEGTNLSQCVWIITAVLCVCTWCSPMLRLVEDAACQHHSRCMWSGPTILIIIPSPIITRPVIKVFKCDGNARLGARAVCHFHDIHRCDSFLTSLWIFSRAP